MVKEPKMAIERSTPLLDKDLGNFHFVLYANFKVGTQSLTGTVEDSKSGHDREGTLKLSAEQQFNAWTHQFAIELEGQFQLVDFNSISEGILNKKKGLFPFVFKAIQGTVKGKLGTVLGCPVELAVGLDTSKDPIIVKVSGQFNSKIGTASVEGELHIGLSVAGWKAVAFRVSKSSLVNFLQEQGYTGVLRYLTSIGLIEVAGALLGTFALVALAAAVTSTERRMGQLRGLDSAYYGGYLKTLFMDSKAPGRLGWGKPAGLSKEEEAIWKVFENAGINDARQHARIVLAKWKAPYDPKDPDDAVLRFQVLLRRSFGTDEKAYDEVNQMLHQCASPVLGR